MQSSEPIKLSVLTARVQNALGLAFANAYVWVIAEVTNHSFYAQKNHHYFDLVEKSTNGTDIVAKMQGVAWSPGGMSIRNFERQTGQKFKNDIQVLVKVSVDFHAAYGLKLTLHEVDINFTIGTLERQKQEALRRLLDECPDIISKEGDQYITANNTLALPAVIQKIAVISSKQSAGLDDFIHTIEANSFGYKFRVVNFHTVVQGEAKAEMVHNKLMEVLHPGGDYDAVVIIRGGGSQTDFLIFDQFILGKTVAGFPIPVITGIGHQKNETIVDLMAHTLTKTPTKAAEFIIAHNRAFEEGIIYFQKSIIIKSQQIFTKDAGQLSLLQSIVINRTRSLLAGHKDHLMRSRQGVVGKSTEIIYKNKTALMNMGSRLSSKPAVIVANKLNSLSHIIQHFKTFNNQYLKNQRSQVGHFGSIIKSMSPENILKKGFALVKVDGVIVSNADAIEAGSEISVILLDKEIKSTVNSKMDYNESDFNL